MNASDKIKVVHLALSMLGVPVFIHLSYIKLYDDYMNTISSVSIDTRYK